MFVPLLVLAILVGLALAFKSLRIQRASNPDDYNKALADLLLRLSVLILGIAFGFFTFFNQRWVEDINKQIDDSNEALGNLDMIQAKYMSATENAYFLNVAPFIEIRKRCQSILVKNEHDGHYCETSRPDSGTLTGADLADISDYFDFEQEKEFYSDFYEKLYEQVFLKRIVTWDSLNEIFKIHHRMTEEYNILLGDLDDIRQLSKDHENAIAARSGEEMISDSGDKELMTFGHDACCAIEGIAEQSETIANLATKQAQNFCTIRGDVLNSLKSRINYVISKLADSRMQEISDRVRGFGKDGDSCKFVPDRIQK